MVSAVDALFVVVVLAGVALCGLGYLSYRRWDQLGVGALAAFAVILGCGHILGGVLGFAVGPTSTDPGAPLWSQTALIAWAIAAVPWLLFTVQYTGRYTEIRWRTVGLLYVPFVGIGLNVVQSEAGVGGAGVANAIASTVFIYCFALVFLGTALLVQASHSYVHLSVRQGVALAATPVLVVLAGNSVGMVTHTSTLLAVSMYTASLTVGTVLFGVAILRDPLLESTPAVETVGERAITRETDDLVFVVDDEGRIVKSNATATETLADSPVSGDLVPDALGEDADTLATVETTSLETATGKRRYDPEVSPITDGRGERLGAVLSLRDVTERELREQRLAVLNRVLRHNLRNKVDVVKSHAEVLVDGNEEHASVITDAADSITELGYQARTIDQFVSESSEPQQVDVVEVVETVMADLGADDRRITITLEGPERAPVETNWQALEGALQSAIDNAIEYAESTVEISLEPREDGYEIVVADNGPGIPEPELESLDSGTETPLQHGTGLGLWQLQWAVTTMGGELSFETTDGTTVRFTVPDQSGRLGSE